MHFRVKRTLKSNHYYILKHPLNYRLGVRLDRTFLNFLIFLKDFKLIFFIVLMLKT
jgi:hypothetical protein